MKQRNACILPSTEAWNTTALLPRHRMGPRLSQMNSAACSFGTVKHRAGACTAL
jgi:hypothetical protein